MAATSARDGEITQEIGEENFTVDALDMQDKIEAEKKLLNEEIAKKIKIHSKNEDFEESAMAKAVAKAKAQKMAKMMKGPSDRVMTTALKAQEKMEKERDAALVKSLIWKITLYKERFPGLEARLPKLGAKPSVVECEEVLNIIREIMMTRGSIASIAQYVNSGFTLLETFWGDGSKLTSVPEPLRFNVNGISNLFRTGKFPELDPILMEIDIEYPWLGRRPLLVRCLSTLVNIMARVHVYNTNPAARKMFDMEEAKPVDLSAVGESDGL
jgi:hypothetical protein